MASAICGMNQWAEDLAHSYFPNIWHIYLREKKPLNNMYIFPIYLEVWMTKKFSTLWVTAHRTQPGQSQGPATPFTSNLWAIFCGLPGYINRKLNCKWRQNWIPRTPIWDTGIPNSGVTHCVTVLVLSQSSLSLFLN